MKRGTLIFVLLIAAFLIAFMFYPVFYVIRESLFPQGRFSLSYYSSLLSNTATRQAFLNSFGLSFAATIFSALIAIPLALITTRYRFPGKMFLTGLILIPMIMPPFVGAIGMRQLFARFGSINLLMMQTGLISDPVDWLGGARFWGVAIVQALHLFPVLYLNCSAALANIDPSLEDASLNLGSNRWRSFRKITLPLMTPGIFAGSIIVFIWAFTDLGTPLIFEYKNVVAVQIFNRITDINDNPEGYALVVVTLLITSLVFLAAKNFFGMKGYESMGKGSVGATEKKLGFTSGILASCAVISIIALACLPHFAVILTSIRERWFMSVLPESYTFKYYEQALGHELTISSIRNSIFLSALSTVVDVVVGIFIAYILVRKKFKGTNLLDAVIMLPLAIPGIVLAFGYVSGFAGTFLDPRINPFPLLVIAYSIRRLPYMVRTAYSGFQQVNVSMEEAAINLGSSSFKALRKITIPLISANVIAGSILVFSFAMLEVSDSLILALKEQFFPITKAIYQLQGRIEDGAYMASALGVWCMVFLAISLIFAGVLLGRKLGQLFRI